MSRVQFRRAKPAPGATREPGHGRPHAPQDYGLRTQDSQAICLSFPPRLGWGSSDRSSDARLNRDHAAKCFDCVGPAGACRPGLRQETFDVVIYTATAGGISAAIQTARMGKKPVVIEPGRHLGGMTSGGLGATDIGNKRAIGGIAREFYQRVLKYYRDDRRLAIPAGRRLSGQAAKTRGRRDVDLRAARGRGDLARNAGRGQSPRPLRAAFGSRPGVVRDGTRIVSIRMETGETYRAPMFIDATYEGDLMATAGVSYHVGREANATYGETLNGVQLGSKQHQFKVAVDPYLHPGQPEERPAARRARRQPGRARPGRRAGAGLQLSHVPDRRRGEPPAVSQAGRLRSAALRIVAADDSGRAMGRAELDGDAQSQDRHEQPRRLFHRRHRHELRLSRRRLRHARKDLAGARQLSAGFDVVSGQRSPRAPANPRRDQPLGPGQGRIHRQRQLAAPALRPRGPADDLRLRDDGSSNCQGPETAADPVGLGAYSMDSHNTQR